MKDVSECIGEIGQSGSTIFSTIDLTAGFWQMILHPRARPYTAFTVPGMGQFQWVTSPMGLLGCPASFQRLMETVVKNIENVIVYIDDLLVHSASHEEHIATLSKVLQCLVTHNIKINLQKCVFGSKEVFYLGFCLTEQGIIPGTDKLKAVKNAPPPSNVQEVRQFLGLCNFFRGHVRNFAQLTSPLTSLTKKDCTWKGGTLPPDALQAFLELQSYLCSEPVVDYPCKN
jgi:Reverse transcriptase (RNA-dependent DNA polymerase)